MTTEQIAERLREVRGDGEYVGSMSGYSRMTIEQHRANYPVSNLMGYCDGLGIQPIITDMTMSESYDVDSVSDVHEVIAMLMKRYEIDEKYLYRKTARHYTPPKEGRTSLSIEVLLAILDAMMCKLDFIKK